MLPKIHVIFVPNSVERLVWCMLSFALHSTASLNFVSNGLNKNEALKLRKLSKVRENWSFLDFPTGTLLPHGTILQRVFDMEKANSEEFFAFMDSDIICFDNIDKWMGKQLEKSDVFSSCTIAKNDTESRQVGLGGQAIMSPSGRNVASSYFCAYRKSTLQTINEQHHVSLERYLRMTQIPASVRKRIPDCDQASMPFDTGKLASWLVDESGGRVRHERHKDLEHLGGMSKTFTSGNFERPMRRNHKKIQDFFNAVLAGNESVDIELDQDWKTRNVKSTAARLRILREKIAENFTDELRDIL